MNMLKFTTTILPALALGVALLSLTTPHKAHAQSHSGVMADHGTMHVTKSPTCGCCGAWVALARKEGFDVETTDTRDVTSIKLDSGLPGPLWSCHTTEFAGYVIEGHVPFEAIRQHLEERPDIAGIAVPGMPFGSPGMGDDPDARFDVITFGGDAAEGEVFYRAGL